MQESPALQYSERTQMRTGVTGHPTPLQISWRVTSFRLILHLCRLRSLREPIEFKPELCGITTHNCQHWNSSYRATFLIGAHCSLFWCIQQLGQLDLWLYRWAGPGSGEGLREELGDDYSVLKSCHFLPESQKWILPFFSGDGCHSFPKETALGNQSVGKACGKELSLRWARRAPALCWAGTGRPSLFFLALFKLSFNLISAPL